MKKIALVVLAVALLCAGCAGPAIRHAVDAVEDTQELVFAEYLAYVAKDPALDKDSKEDRAKAVEAARHAVAALKRAAEE